MPKTWISEAVAIAAVLIGAIPPLLDMIPPGSKAYGFLGAVLALCFYLKGHNDKKIAAATIAAATGPSQPPA